MMPPNRAVLISRVRKKVKSDITTSHNFIIEIVCDLIAIVNMKIRGVYNVWIIGKRMDVLWGDNSDGSSRCIISD